jgi:hypothetical protein
LEERLAGLEGRAEELLKRIDDFRNDMNHRFMDLRNLDVNDNPHAPLPEG